MELTCPKKVCESKDFRLDGLKLTEGRDGVVGEFGCRTCGTTFTAFFSPWMIREEVPKENEGG